MKKIVAAFSALLLIGILIGYGVSWFFQQTQEKTRKAPVRNVENRSWRQVQLYFTALDGAYLVPETVEIPDCNQESDCIRGLVTELIKGSRLGYVAVLPPQAEILKVEVENDLVTLDFSRKLLDFHPGGSLAELLSLYAIVNSLHESFPYLRQVRILIEGQTRQTLKGHARIDQPVFVDYTYNSPPQMELNDPATTERGISIESLIEAAEGGDDDGHGRNRSFDRDRENQP